LLEKDSSILHEAMLKVRISRIEFESYWD